VASGCEFKVGQLVEYRAWYDGDGAWISIENQIGVVLEIITITEYGLQHIDEEIIIYDIRVYWLSEGVIEVVPDLLLAEYGHDKVSFI
tara:strand:- start:3003 stop:3266 length:264 start_codon:yes stop_codon:yes gene_type:complete